MGPHHLKTLQKVEILRTYTIPQIIYLADHSKVRSESLDSLDLKIRSAVKEWLHLPTCTCDAIIYSRRQDSGLGIIKLSALVPSIQA